jgi:hypothetical protein
MPMGFHPTVQSRKSAARSPTPNVFGLREGRGIEGGLRRRAGPILHRPAALVGAVQSPITAILTGCSGTWLRFAGA